MKHVRFAALAGIVALAACSESPVDTTQQPSFSAHGAQQSVTGHVERYFAAIDLTEKFSFSAIRTPKATVNGRFEVHDYYADGTMDRITGDVQCFVILPDGKTARVAGVITSSTNAQVPAGLDAIWTVRDNGEGSQDLDDAATDLSWGHPSGTAQRHCDVGVRFYTGPHAFSLRGNVQVRP